MKRERERIFSSRFSVSCSLLLPLGQWKQMKFHFYKIQVKIELSWELTFFSWSLLYNSHLQVVHSTSTRCTTWTHFFSHSLCFLSTFLTHQLAPFSWVTLFAKVLLNKHQKEFCKSKSSDLDMSKSEWQIAFLACDCTFFHSLLPLAIVFLFHIQKEFLAHPYICVRWAFYAWAKVHLLWTKCSMCMCVCVCFSRDESWDPEKEKLWVRKREWKRREEKDWVINTYLLMGFKLGLTWVKDS